MAAEEDLSSSLSVYASALSQLLAAYTRPALAQAKLNYGTFELLSAIRGAGEGAKQIEIARRLGITAPSLSEAVKAAANQGLVEQLPGTDGRTKRVVLTKKGAGALQTVLSAVEEAERSMIRGISATDLRFACGVMRRAVANLGDELASSGRR